MEPGEVDATLFEFMDSGNMEMTLKYLKQHGLTPGRSRIPRPVFTAPVTMATYCGESRIVETLLSMGYDPSEDAYFEGDFWNAGGSDFVANPIHIACDKGNLDTVSTLMEVYGVDVDVPDSQGFTPLWYALKGRFRDFQEVSQCLVEYLIDAGASLDVHLGGCTYLHWAARRESSVCECIISHGVDVNASGHGGDTPLHVAVLYSMDNVLSLLEGEADVNPENDDKQTPFLCAINATCLTWEDKTDILRLLCEYGANPNLPDNTGNTALTYALRNGENDTVRFLVVDLNVNLQDEVTEQDDLNALFLDCIKVLETPRPRGNESNFQQKYLECIKLVVRAGLNPGQSVLEHVIKGVLSNFPKEKKFIEYLKQVTSKPRTLKELSCFKIRRVLGRRLLRDIDRLPLPQRLMKVVKMEDLLAESN